MARIVICNAGSVGRDLALAIERQLRDRYGQSVAAVLDRPADSAINLLWLLEWVAETVEACDALVLIVDRASLESLKHLDRKNRAGLCVLTGLETALKHRRPVLPVLSGEAPLPFAADLPQSLHSLAFRPPLVIASVGDKDGLVRLGDTLDALLRDGSDSNPAPPRNETRLQSLWKPEGPEGSAATPDSENVMMDLSFEPDEPSEDKPTRPRPTPDEIRKEFELWEARAKVRRQALSLNELADRRQTVAANPSRVPPDDTGTMLKSPPSEQVSGGSARLEVMNPIIPFIAVFLGLGITLALVYRQETAAWAGAILKLFQFAAPPVPPPVDPPPRDLVDVSAFAPDGARPGEQILVQVFLHRAEQAAEARALARESDADATRRGVSTLESEIAHGSRVDVVLEGDGVTIDEPAQYLVWRGAPRACQFFVTLPESAESPSARAVQFRVRILVDQVPIGSLRFSLRMHQEPAADSIGIKGESARRYGRAFLAYSSQDRAEVLKRAQALRALHIDFFQDLLSLEPGQAWEERLFQEIDRCDLFLLFWSSTAAKSDWVIRETEHALARRDRADLPDIMPIILEGPPVPEPPKSLEAIHFNDALRYVIAAVEAQGPPVFATPIRLKENPAKSNG